MSGEWEELVRLLGLPLDTINRFRYQHPDNDIKCCKMVFGEWISRNGYPPNYYYSWDGLHELLVDLEYDSLADVLKEALECHGVYIKVQ